MDKQIRKKAKTFFLPVRGYVKQISLRNSQIQNVYYGCIQKTGSQWVKQIFSDFRIQKYTKLMTYPQHRYEWGEFKKQFPLYTFVPCLYISYNLYEEIKKPKSYKTFYIIRDPRNIVVSWYYSMLETHPLMGKVGKNRMILEKLSFEEGISYCIEALQLKFSFMRDWMQNQSDPNVLILKFEDLTKEPEPYFKNFFSHCEIDIPDEIIYSVISDYSKEKMREKDLNKRQQKSESHYRKKSSTWQDVFTEEHKRLFTDINGNLIDILDY